ncbi:MAG: HlyD family efflux transporter periplasmic adaptor subunit [Bacteroidia bacterium]|nr:HlyD family efflux transporter periplasmic adaptor subunit [Bacteroidia bacterium]
MQDCLESYIYKHTTRSQLIYITALVALLACLVALPLIYVDVTVQNAGMIRPVNERAEIKASVSEWVDSVYVREGAYLQQGDTILRLRTDNLLARQRLLQQKMSDVGCQLSDLNQLIRGNTPQHFASGVRMQENAYYTKRKNELETLLQKAQNEHTRNKQLFDKEVIAPNEYEQYLFALRKAENEYSSLKNSQLSSWQTDQNTLAMSHAELQSSLNQLQKEREMHYITSPVNGTLEQFTEIYRGNSITAGQTLGVVSPDSTLYAEVYVSPRNIGYLHMEMPVNVQVESFNYNEWGTIPGKVYEISSDFYFDNNTQNSYYKVKCELSRDYLTLKNGRHGQLKKGMTVYAHFVLTRRSLFDLLYQKIDHWINPTQYNK